MIGIEISGKHRSDLINLPLIVFGEVVFVAEIDSSSIIESIVR